MSGGILSDQSIAQAVSRYEIKIDPFDAGQLNPASYDLRLGDKVMVYADVAREVPQSLLEHFTPELLKQVQRTDGWNVAPKAVGDLDSKKVLPTTSFSIGPEGWLLRPGILYLMHTREVVAPCSYVACVDGKSSLARLGIVAHLTAGFIDPGFAGQITLEVSVVHPVRVYAGMRFCQVRFHTVVGDCTPYAGNYVGATATGPVPSRSWKQFEEE
jgi:dCTP deaminase